MYCTTLDVTTVNVRSVQHHLGRYLQEVESGAVLEVRRRNKVIARFASAYVDSGVLVKLYVREPNSDMAARSVRHHTGVPLNGLMELELRSTFQMLEVRNVLNDGQRAAAERFLELDCVEGRLHRTAVNWTEILHHSIALSAKRVTRGMKPPRSDRYAPDLHRCGSGGR